MTTSNDGVPTTIADVTTTTATASKAEEEPERMLLPPYIWDACQPPSEDTLQLWVEVGNKLDKESTVVWSQSVETLQEASKFLSISREARDFVEKYMGQIIGILLEQQPATVGVNERQCVHDSLNTAVTIIANDLEIQNNRGRRSRSGNPNVVGCSTLEVLGVLFNKKKIYYKGTRSNWNVQNLSGLPQTRLNIVEEFLVKDGFAQLVTYMTDRISIVDQHGCHDHGHNPIDNVGGDVRTSSVVATATTEESFSTIGSTTVVFSDNNTNNNNTDNNHTTTAISPSATPQRREPPPSLSAVREITVPAVTTVVVPSTMPSIDILYQVLTALLDACIAKNQNNQNNNDSHHHQGNRNSEVGLMSLQQATVGVAKTVMRYITSCTEEMLKKFNMDELKFLLNDLHKIFDRFIESRRSERNDFYVFWRALVLKLITSQSLPLKLFGWQQLEQLMQACENSRPPPRTYVARGAGCDIVNGTYNFNGIVTEDGYGLRSSNNDIVYERIVPLEEYEEEEQQQQQSNPNDGDGGNNSNNGRSSSSNNNRNNFGRGSREKKLTLFRCTMRSQQKWWFLSEADEDQPGTDRDTDYYQHKSKEHEEWEPPSAGWVTCRNAGVDPPPKLTKVGAMVPPGEEQNTLEHQLAKWAIENKIIDTLVLGDSVHREIVSRSVPLIKFLASMCNHDDDNDINNDGIDDVDDGGTRDIEAATNGTVAATVAQTTAPVISTEGPLPPAHQQQFLVLANAVNGGHHHSDDYSYCLQTSHLLLAWKTCIRKTDAAVSAQVYQLLVTVLFSCPSSLAVSLLEAVHESLVQSQQPQTNSISSDNNNININNAAIVSSNSMKNDDCLNEVSDFCEALAISSFNNNSISNNNNNTNNKNNRSGPILELTDRVRAEVLKLLWSVLIHPDASSLKSYDTLKQFVTRELRIEPGGKEHRETYLRFCVSAMSENSKRQTCGSVDEIRALKMVKLTHFVLEACPRNQAAELVMSDQGGLPLLLFEELTSFLKRNVAPTATGRIFIQPQTPPRKSPSIDTENANATISLSERLRILRYVFGVSEQIYMSTPQIHSLWQLCSAPPDREEVMAFIASASGTALRNCNTSNNNIVDSKNNACGVADQAPTNQGNNSNNNINNSNMIEPDSEKALSSAFTEDECAKAFVTLFCSPNISYQQLGEKAYTSFRFMFNKMKLSATHGSSVRQAALDTLWRICLVTGNDTVASSAMTDLLNIYIGCTVDHNFETNTSTTTSSSNTLSLESMQTESIDDSFGKRVFDCLSKVKKSLDRKDPSSELAAERCLRILNTAIGQIGSSGSITISTLNRFSNINTIDGLRSITKCLPLGMRGKACYRKIIVQAKRPQQQQQQERDPNWQRDWRIPLSVHPLETMHSVKVKISLSCKVPVEYTRLINAIGRVSSSATRKQTGADGSTTHMAAVPDDTVVDEIGIVQGSEIVVMITDRQVQQQNMNNFTNARAARNGKARDLSDIFCDDKNNFSDDLFNTLLGVLKSLPWREPDEMSDASASFSNTHKLVWDLLLAMPTNPKISTQILSTVRSGDPADSSDGVTAINEDAMDIDTHQQNQWAGLLDLKNFSRSVYVLLAIDAFLQPANEILSSLPNDEERKILERELGSNSTDFRREFISSGGFDAVVRFFSFSEGSPEMSQSMTRRGNAVALRILKCCLFSDNQLALDDSPSNELDVTGSRLMQSLVNAEGLLRSLTLMVVADNGISSSTVSDVLKFLCLLFKSPATVKSFASLPDDTPEKFLVKLLLWEGGSEDTQTGSSISSNTKMRRDTHELVLATPLLAHYALTWLKNEINSIEVTSECTNEYFYLLLKLVAGTNKNVSQSELASLGTAVCLKLAACPRPSSETVVSVDFPTGVLRGCLALLDALIAHVGGSILMEGTNILLKEFRVARWSESINLPAKPKDQDLILIDLMGIIFDAFLSPGGATSIMAICCNDDSKRHGFNVVKSAARACTDGNGYIAVAQKISGLVSVASPFLKHRWGQGAGGNEGGRRHGRNSSKYSGLKNQGCTCYMNSVLQQLFMMPELRKSFCSAPLPASVRSSGGVVSARGAELVEKKVALNWENGQSYFAIVEAFDSGSGMHTIKYCPIVLADSGESNYQQNVTKEDIDRLPTLLSEEFFLSEGRPGKESGVFEVLTIDGSKGQKDNNSTLSEDDKPSEDIKETEDEASSRHLMEEVQRTFIHLEEGSRGRCFDPRALVEACACLKLEFDVWQQNDASEFSTKLLDRLETSLKRWAPDHFQYLDHTFGLKQTKQKICKECGLKSNREEKLLNVDCQIRGKSDIHEALATMCETEIMEGNNQVFCDRCKKNTDTVLRSAISELPNMLILSLKRFDLDYNTFETVKLNSRCAFDQTLNMKRYTLEGVEAIEQAATDNNNQDDNAMDVGTDENTLSHLPDEDYEYKLAGVLVHAGVAQGGHYYSFINDRNPGSEDKWYRFDDEDVTPFDPVLIASECFGGKVKKETKWPNGQVHSTESEQFANALMLFYEKVKITERPLSISQEKIPNEIHMTTGYDVFEPDVRRSNATHRWQSFLFDDEFQNFLRNFLHLCRWPDHSSNLTMNIVDNPDLADTEKSLGWRKNVTDMLVTYMFDALLYANNRSHLADWTNTLEDVMHDNPDCAQAFVSKVASKTLSISGNWLRTYLLDCPIYQARIAFDRVLVVAIRSCLVLSDEQQKLKGWISAWEKQYPNRFDYCLQNNIPYPCRLEDKFADHENLRSPSASAIGINLSFLNVLIEALPRCWKQHSEIFLFIRNLAWMDTKYGGDLFRHALVSCQVSTRMICFAGRNGIASTLKSLFPGSTVSVEVAETQAKPEQAQNNLNMNGNQAMNSDLQSFRGNCNNFDYTPIFESVAVFLGITKMIPADLLVEKEDPNGHKRIVLSLKAKDAFSIVFDESCEESMQGMGQSDIEDYLQRCGHEQVPAQRILDIISKYTSANGGNGCNRRNYLNLSGFLTYYRDTAQREDNRVRNDLYHHGFRPDLSRRPRDDKVTVDDGQEGPVDNCDSIAQDIAIMFNDRDTRIGPISVHALAAFDVFHRLHSTTSNDILTEYILAAGFFKERQTSHTLIVGTLKQLFQAQSGWAAQDIVASAAVVLKVMCAIPDEFQSHRIDTIMMCDERVNNHCIGLIRAADVFRNIRPRSSSYAHESYAPYERYIEMVKAMYSNVPAVTDWMERNRRSWQNIERDLYTDQQSYGSSHSRRDYPGTRDNDDVGYQMDHHHQSDSDCLPSMNESEDDDDSRFDESNNADYGHDITGVVVSNGGYEEINGTYRKNGICENALQFNKRGVFDGKEVVFSLFKCNVSNNTQHWYISIVPYGSAPGTSSDIDFYSAGVDANTQNIPPRIGWTKSNEGVSPSPTVEILVRGTEPPTEASYV